MIVVIIAGGSGTRLWPLSTHNFPKHLLKLTSNDRSLLQNTYDRVKPLTEDKNIFVVPEKSHAKHVYKQLPDLPRKNVLVEPARRGTASCFILALSEIKRRRLNDQAIFFLWADHLVSNKRSFAKAVEQAAKLAEAERRLVFMGIKPTYPSTGFGYIKRGKKIKNDLKDVYELEQFVEKPKSATAKLYLKNKNYLWNTGYLTGTLETFEREIKEHAPRLWNDYQELFNTLLPISRRRIYMNFVAQPIDTALSEHIPDGLVVPGEFDWADVGSFHDLHDVSKQDGGGNHVSGEHVELENVTDSYVRNEADIPVAVIGLDNVAVIATDNGILVTNKTHAQKVGDISKKLQAGKKDLKWFEKL
ncbi:MAG TPA: sugar phosphate nucleotidyltransferase [Candidatus Saccharimonadales bacterium]|nr:sugar phosphate nucleotidyltransferase [Candidatus Saccharimonadales bacterium]